MRFSTGFDSLFQELQHATKDNLKKAHTFIDSFEARGGTNISDTLYSVMGLRPTDDGENVRTFVVVFLTDGKGNREADEILAVLKNAKSQGMRMFPFGVGHDVNTILLDRLANAYTGRPTYVQPGENLELVLGDFFSVISQPVLTNLRLTLPDAGVTEQFPATLGDLYNGQQLIIAGKFSEAATGPLKLTASRDGKQVEYIWPKAQFANTTQAKYVPAVWAGRKISFLIDQIRAHGESQEMIDEILQLSQEYGIQTPYSSWLIVPEQHRLALGLRQRTIRRNGRLRGGVGGLGGGGGAPGPPASAGRRMKLPSAPPGGVAGEGPRSTSGILKYPEAFYGDINGAIDLTEAELSVAKASGKVANLIARKNAALKDMRNRDNDRLSDSLLLVRKINSRWYHKMGAYLVDEDFNEDTKLITVKFGSDAYFDLALNRADLREVLAANRNVLVLVADKIAVLIAENEGIEDFSEKMREEFSLAGD